VPLAVISPSRTISPLDAAFLPTVHLADHIAFNCIATSWSRAIRSTARKQPPKWCPLLMPADFPLSRRGYTSYVHR